MAATMIPLMVEHIKPRIVQYMTKEANLLPAIMSTTPKTLKAFIA